MSERLTLVEGNVEKTLEIETGTTLLEALIRAGDHHVDAACSGRGLCGKCRVRASGRLSEPEERERSRLSAAEFEEGWRLACLTRVQGPARIDRPGAAAATILAEGPHVSILPDPPARWLTLSLVPPNLLGQASDEERLLRAATERCALLNLPAPASVAFPALAQLALLARGEVLRALVRGEEILAVEAVDPDRKGISPGGDVGNGLGIGIDIGTTTVVAYLVDLDTGAIIGTKSGLNEQRVFGADVISRIQATMERAAGLEELRERIAGQLSGLAKALLAEAGARPTELVSLAIAGNTTMIHLLAGVAPAAISTAPFPPVFTALRVVGARELDLDLSASASVFLLPGLAAYVGADIVAGIAALGMAEDPRLSLLLDIGTNGELALGSSAGVFCCATAAGPAFEGAGISMGMGGVEGAIDSVWIDEGRLGCSTIGGKPAKGLCGSGVLDALASFLELGLIDETGRMLDADEAGALGGTVAALRDEGEEGPRLRVCEGIHLSQGDVRQLQLATAAIAAGIEVLIARSGKTVRDIDRIFLAGGFGSYMDVRSAIRIGLIPRELGDRVVVVGNSSGAGAVAAVLSRARLSACDQARSRCSYVELSSSPEFNDAFVEHLFFPEAENARMGR